MARTTVLIPNYNGIDYIEACIESVMAASEEAATPASANLGKGAGASTTASPASREEPYPIIVVDNGSCDGSREVIEAHISGDALPVYEHVLLIPLSENTGFSNAVNVGLEHVKTPYVFLLNNDTTIRPGAISALERRMDSNERIFSAQSRILDMHKSRPASAQPASASTSTSTETEPSDDMHGDISGDILDDCGDLYCALGWAFTPGKGKPAEAYDRPCSVFACCGAAVMYRMSMFEDTGVFDEEHFAYLEDIDLGYRARIMGYKNVYEPASEILHAGSAVSGSRHNRFKVNLSAQNSVYIIYKNMPLVQFLINLPLLLIGFIVKALFFSVKLMGFTYLRGLIRGFGLIGRDIKNGLKHKVWFRPRNLGHYLLIQMELWVNTVRRFAG